MILTSASPLVDIPRRIVSLVPSQTELLHYIGLEQETVGITKFCVHPPQWSSTKMIVGGTKTLDAEIIQQLQPDLIIANKEENVKEQVEALANDFPVWVTDVNNLEDALSMIADIGQLTGRKEKAAALVTSIEVAFEKIPSIASPTKTAYLIWRKPYITVGGDCFINDMLRRCGYINLFADQKRYPELSIEQLQTAGCELILLPSEPYPFKEKHIPELEKALPGVRFQLVDGEMFSWYGSRLLSAAAYFRELAHSRG